MSNLPSLYSYRFARDVVERFMESYSRGCNFVVRLLGIDLVELQTYLIKCVRSPNQTNWEAMKRIIKMHEREDMQDYRRWSFEEGKKYLTYVKYAVQDDILDGKKESDF